MDVLNWVCLKNLKVGVSKKRIQYYSKSDDDGKCSFSLHWLVNYTPGHPDGEYKKRERGQHYYMDPREKGFLRPEKAIIK